LSAAPVIERLTVIGVGLIGGSLARALKSVGYCGEIVGAGRNLERLEIAADLGVVDRIETDFARAVSGADVVFVAVPLGATRGLLDVIAPHLPGDAVLTDAGSAKGCVVEDARAAFGHIPGRFVPGHPIAGTERSGVEASFAELFNGRRVILTPLAETELQARDRVARMWEAAGARVEDMGVQHHDAVLAATDAASDCLSIHHLSEDRDLATLDQPDNFVRDMQACGMTTMARIREACRRGLEQDGADVIVLGCTCMQPTAALLEADGLPVIEPMVSGYRHLESLVREAA